MPAINLRPFLMTVFTCPVCGHKIHSGPFANNERFETACTLHLKFCKEEASRPAVPDTCVECGAGCGITERAICLDALEEGS